MANSYRNCNKIEKLVINGDITSNLMEVKDHIFHFFTQLYLEDESWRLDLHGVPFLSISEVEVAWVLQAFEEREVFKVLKDINGDKALGPDEFFMAFFRSCWDVIKFDVIIVFLEFHEYQKKFECDFHLSSS